MKNDSRQFHLPHRARYRYRCGLWTVLALALMITLSFAQGAGAAIIYVDTNCSLQEAIYSANSNNNTGGCEQGSGDDTIVLPPEAVFEMGTIFDDADNFMGPTATPIITSTIIIEANGSRLERTAGSPDFRAFAVGPNGNLTIRNAHIKGFSTKGGRGGSEGGGGGMGAGGAIYLKDGGLTVENSTFEGNSATGGNGGIFQGTGATGGGGGLSGNGGNGSTFNGGGGGGGSRGKGGSTFICGGGGGGGTLSDGGSCSGLPCGTGGLNCGGTGGASDGTDGTCPGGGGGGGGSCSGTKGGNGNYGGGGGGGASHGGNGGFGGGGGAGSSTGGNGGFGGGGGWGFTAGGGTGSGAFGGNAGSDSSGGGGGGAALGGAIFNDSGTVVIRNSTFTANRVTGGAAGGVLNSPNTTAIAGAAAGGAIFSRNGSLTVLNSTVSGNQSADIDPGISVFGDGLTTTFTLRNTIIANNGADECHFAGSVTHNGSGNLIVSNLGCQGVVSQADPQLGLLQLNPPGSTPTMAINANSPAFNTADAGTSLSIDQRGVTRPQAGGFDIGAYEVLPPPDLTIYKTGPSAPTAGTDVTYTINAANIGVGDAWNVSLTDTIAAPVTFVSLIAPAGWMCTKPAVGATGAVTCTKSTFLSGASATFTLVVHLSPSAPNASQLCDTASISTTTSDPVSSNNSFTGCGTIQTLADLALTQTATTTGNPGKGTATFTLKVKNNGPSDSQNITLVANSSLFTGPPPAINASAGGTCTVSGSNVTCTWATLALGASDTVTISVPWRSAIGSVCDSATVSSGTPDPNSTNSNSTVCAVKKK